MLIPQNLWYNETSSKGVEKYFSHGQVEVKDSEENK